MVEQIEANTRQLQHSVLTLTSPPGDDTDNFETFFPKPIYAPAGRGLEIALNGLRTYRSWANVNDTNNRLVYILDAGRTWLQIEIPDPSRSKPSLQTWRKWIYREVTGEKQARGERWEEFQASFNKELWDTFN